MCRGKPDNPPSRKLKSPFYALGVTDLSPMLRPFGPQRKPWSLGHFCGARNLHGLRLAQSQFLWVRPFRVSAHVNMPFHALDYALTFSGKGRTHRPPGFQSLSGPWVIGRRPCRNTSIFFIRGATSLLEPPLLWRQIPNLLKVFVTQCQCFAEMSPWKQIVFEKLQ